MAISTRLIENTDLGQVAGEWYIDAGRQAPEYFRNVIDFEELYKAQGYELGTLQHDLEDLAQQAFLTTATWGLMFWEEMYGVTTDLSLTYDERREVVYAKMRGQGTTTKKMIQQTAESFSGGEVEVIEHNADHLIIIHFVGTVGIPRNMAAFSRMIEDIIPAHLRFEYKYRYATWREVKEHTWGDHRNRTWGDVKMALKGGG